MYARPINPAPSKLRPPGSGTDDVVYPMTPERPPPPLTLHAVPLVTPFRLKLIQSGLIFEPNLNTSNSTEESTDQLPPEVLPIEESKLIRLLLADSVSSPSQVYPAASRTDLEAGGVSPESPQVTGPPVYVSVTVRVSVSSSQVVITAVTGNDINVAMDANKNDPHNFKFGVFTNFTH
jgi:hypothetical protein